MDDASQIQMYRCERCGVESAVREAFVVKTDLKGLVRSAICFECKTKKDAKSLLSLYLILPAFGVLFMLSPSFYGLGVFYLEMFAGLLLTIPLIVLHELSHALMASLLGLRVFAIHLGAGKVVFTARAGGIRWYFKQFPLLGLTVVGGPEMSWMRLRIFLLHLAGPGLHAVLIILLGLVLRAFPELEPESLVNQAIWIGICSNAFLLITNLYPRKSLNLINTGTDGWAMLNIFKTSPQEMQIRYAGYYIQQALDAVDRGENGEARQWAEQGLARYPQQPMMINAVGYVYTHLHEFDKARAAFLNVLECAEKPSESVKFMALNNVAYADLMLEDPALLEQADDFSQQAYKNYPWEPAIGGTRGAVLVELGKVAEGLNLLKDAMARNPDKRSKALDACLIAEGEMKRGNLSEAKKYLSAAMDLDPQCLLLERTRRMWQAQQG